MKRMLAVFALGLLALYGTRSARAGDELVLIENGQSAYTIVVPDGDDPGNRLGEAAALLRDTLEKSTGVRLPLVKESLFEGGPAVYLGMTAAARAAGLPLDEIGGWSFIIRAVDDNLFMVGEDASAGIPGAESLGYQGTMRAVTVFLEDQAGVRFVFPGAKGWHIPALERLAVRYGLEVSWTPLFDYVIGRRARDRAYSIANHFFSQTPVLRTYGGHSYYTAVPAEEYDASHPEYFAYTGGARSHVGNHLCISNPDVQELMLREMERQLDRGYRWVELAQTDGYVACECPACQALHPDIGERVWIVHRQLAAAMLSRRPDGKVMIISYGPTGDPPVSFTNFPENVIIQMCRYTAADFKNWAPFNVAKTVYIYNWGRAWPRVSPRHAVEQVRMFLDNGVRGIYLCGGLDQGLAAWGLFAPSYYAFGKALADPTRDADELEREFIDAAFGEVAAPMRAFFSTMHRRMEVNALLDRVRNYAVFPKTGDFETHFFPPKVLADMSRYLERAKERAADDNVRARLELVEAEFTYVRSVASVYHVYRAYRVMPSWTSLELLERKVKEYQAAMDWLYPDGKARPAGGLRAPFNGRIVRQGGAPFSWDFALLREQEILPGAGAMPSIEAARISLDELDGRFDKPAWEGRQTCDLREINMGRLPNAARFRVAYDDDNVYIALEGELHSLDAIDALVAGGAVWRQESFELVIDVCGERERYYHFMLNPLPDSSMTRRFGFIEDTEHPLYGKFEPWEGQWDYTACVDRDNKRWSAEVRIPFSTLDTPRPSPGSGWTINVGRTDYSGPGNRVFALWSPNLETRSFHERSVFGDVIFK